MKRKILFLSSIGFMALSLVGCNSKIQNDEAEDIITNAIENTNKKLEEISNSDATHFSFDLDMDYSSTTLGAKEQAKVLIESQGNLNLKKLRAETPDTSDSNFYFYLNVDAIGESYNLPPIPGLSNEYYTIIGNAASLKNNTYTEYSKTKTNYTDLEFGYDYLIDEVKSKALADSILSAIDDITNTDDSNYSILSEYLEEFGLFESVKGILNDDLNGKDLEELFERIQIDISDVDEDDLDSIANLINEVNPKNYVTYTKTKKSKNVTISSKFDYEKWYQDFSNGFNNSEFVINSEDLVEMLDILPSSFKLDYSITIDKDNYISAIDANVEIVGPQEENITLYDMSLTISAHLNLTNKNVQVKTLTIPESAQSKINELAALAIRSAFLEGRPFTYENLTKIYGEPYLSTIDSKTGTAYWAEGCHSLKEYSNKIANGEHVPMLVVDFAMGIAVSVTYID